ncbi:MAG: hypothetical protein NVSMB32_00710 [Actinomycetota bacterium]
MASLTGGETLHLLGRVQGSVDAPYRDQLVDSFALCWSPLATYCLIAWSFVIEFAGAAINLPRWALDMSLLHHLAVAPDARPHWAGAGVLVALGLTGTLLGGLALWRRDLAGQ